MPACLLHACLAGLRTFGSKLQAINMRAGLFVNVDEVRVGRRGRMQRRLQSYRWGSGVQCMECTSSNRKKRSYSVISYHSVGGVAVWRRTRAGLAQSLWNSGLAGQNHV